MPDPQTPTQTPAQTLAQLNDSFALPGILHFEQPAELIRAQITLPTCAATIYLHGAHLVHFQPTGTAPVLFLSSTSELAPNKPIRGGIPICFPWFAGRSDGQPGPSHGFARLQQWTFANAALLPGPKGANEPILHLTFTLGPSDLSRSLGFDHFRVAYELIFGADQGRTLTLRLTVANAASTPLHFEEALHSYFSVNDVRTVEIIGLEQLPYLDKTDHLKQKTTPPTPLVLTQTTDRVFPSTTNPITVHDRGSVAGGDRLISIHKLHSSTTVVWNPWAESNANMPDLAPNSWPHFLCVETANTAANAITLPPNQVHTMESIVSVNPTK